MKRLTILFILVSSVVFGQTNDHTYANYNWVNNNGNSGTDSTINYIGTSDNVALRFATFGITRGYIDRRGNWKLGLTGQTIIDSTGNFTQIRGVTTSFPSSQGAASTVLTNNGSGTLTWAAPTVTTAWNLTGNSTSSGSNIFGTISNNIVKIITNNVWRGTFDSTGYFGFGDSAVNSIDRMKITIGSKTDGVRIYAANDSPYMFLINNATYGTTDAKAFSIYQGNTGVTHIGNNGDAILIGTSGNTGIGALSDGTIRLYSNSSSMSGSTIYAMYGWGQGTRTNNIGIYAYASGGTNNYALITGASGGLVGINVEAPTKQFQVAGDIAISTIGKKYWVKEGTNGCSGSGTLSSGTTTISTTCVTASSRIYTQDTQGGTFANIGSLTIGTITAGTSFVVTSTNPLDNSNFNWEIKEPY